MTNWALQQDTNNNSPDTNKLPPDKYEDINHVVNNLQYTTPQSPKYVEIITPEETIINTSNIDICTNYNDDQHGLTNIDTTKDTPTVNSMSLQDINEILQIQNTNMKTSTKNDLNKYINDFWTLPI